MLVVRLFDSSGAEEETFGERDGKKGKHDCKQTTLQSGPLVVYPDFSSDFESAKAFPLPDTILSAHREDISVAKYPSGLRGVVQV